MNLRDSLLPSKLEFVLYGVLAVAIIFVGNIGFLTDYFLRGTDYGYETLREQAGQVIGNALSVIEGLYFTPSTAVFVFWSLVGVVIFSFGQAVINTYQEFKRDVDISARFIHPRSFVNSQFWLDVTLQTAAHAVLYVMVLMWSLLLGFVLAPLAAGAVPAAVLDPNLLTVGGFVCLLILLSIGILVEAILLKLLFKRKQLAL